MNKKYLIIIVVVLIALAVAAVMILSSSNIKKNQESAIEKNQANALPIEISEVDVMRVDNIEDSNQIKKSYNDYVSQGHNYRKYKYYEAEGISDFFSPSDKDVNLVPIENFLNSIDADINSKVKSIAGKNYYSLFYCINREKEKEYGIAFDLSDEEPAKTKSNYSSAEGAMIDWEPYLLKDIHNILFPSDKLESEDINQPLLFKNGEYRYAKVNLPNRESSINYKVTGDPLNLIIIATSSDCLSSALEVFSGLD